MQKEQTRAAFAELNLLFAIIMPQIGWQLPGLLSKNKEMKKKVSDPAVCSGFSLHGRRGVELSVRAEVLDGSFEACGTALSVSNCINETVSALGSLLYICCSNSECEETNICRTINTHRSSRKTNFLCKREVYCWIHILLCIETKQENIWRIGIDQQSFLQVSLSSIVAQKQKNRTLPHWNTKRQRYKIVENKDS